MKTYNYWTEEEENYVLENYKKLGKKTVALELNKTELAVKTKYYKILREIEKQGFKQVKGSEEKQQSCPICGKPSNAVTSCINDSVKTVYYCTNCLMEFKDNKLIPPLLNKEGKSK